MSLCPKCGTGEMSRPRYSTLSRHTLYHAGGECLIYTCMQCGYEKSAPCVDSEETKKDELEEFLIKRGAKRK